MTVSELIEYLRELQESGWGGAGVWMEMEDGSTRAYMLEGHLITTERMEDEDRYSEKAFVNFNVPVD